VIKVLKSKKLKVEAGRLSNGFFAFFSVTSSSSSSSFFFGASFFGASCFFGASYFLGASLAGFEAPLYTAYNY